jgi:hypothetical protein
VRRVSSGGRHPDLCEHVPLRGGARECGSRPAQRITGGSLQPFDSSRAGDHGVLEQLRRRGTSSHLVVRRRTRGEGRSFSPGGSARADPSSSFQPVIGATTDGVAGSPASGAAKSGGRRQSTSWRACRRRVASVDGVARFAACLPREGQANARHVPRKGEHVKRGQTRRTRGSKRTVRSRRARIGRSRGVPARRNVCCRSR